MSEERIELPPITAPAVDPGIEVPVAPVDGVVEGGVLETPEVPEITIESLRAEMEGMKSKHEKDIGNKHFRENQAIRDLEAYKAQNPPMGDRAAAAAPVVDKTEDDFASYEAFESYKLETLVDARMAQKEAEMRASTVQMAENAKMDAYRNNAAAYSHQNPEYAEVLTANAHVPMAQHVVDVILALEGATGPSVEHALYSNLSELDRVNRLDPIGAAMAISQMASLVVKAPAAAAAPVVAPATTKPYETSGGSGGTMGAGSSGSLLSQTLTPQEYLKRHKAGER